VSATTPGKGVLILGIPRSGTTLLRRLVDAHPSFACPGETMLFSACARFLTAEPGVNGIDMGVLTGLHFAGFPADVVLERLRAFAFAFHEEHAARANKPRWAEKSAPDVFHLAAIEELCADRVQYVCIARHALDTLVSLSELIDVQQRWSSELHPYIARHPRPLEALAHAWVDGTEAMLDLARRRPADACVVRYEDLVTKPADEMTRVMAHLGEAWPRGLEASALAEKGGLGLGDWKTYGKDKVETSSVGRHKSLSRLTVQELARIVNPTLVRAGYDALPEGPRPPRERALRLFEATLKVQGAKKG
jgi:hypothetical protein